MLKKTKLTLTAIASLIIATTSHADPHYTDAQIAVIAKKCGVSFKFAKEALDAGFHYIPVDNSLEGGYARQEKPTSNPPKRSPALKRETFNSSGCTSKIVDRFG